MAAKVTKILISVFLASLLILSGCARDTIEPAANTDNEQTLTIATSFYPMYVFVLNIVRDIPNVEVFNLTPPMTGCLHDYSLTPDDMKNLEKADIFVINGAGMESFLDKVLNQMPDLKIIEASKGITLLRGDGDVGNNPHVWVSISNAITEVENIRDQLSSLDPGNAAKYLGNSGAYIQKLSEQRDKMHQELDGIENRNIITFHEAFPYFAQEFNLNIIGVIEREPGAEPSAKELAETIEKVKASGVKALFVEPQYPAKTAEIIAKESGAQIYTLDPVVTGPLDAEAYQQIMENNLQTLKEALR